jgi:hypothetical protein
MARTPPKLRDLGGGGRGDGDRRADAGPDIDTQARERADPQYLSQVTGVGAVVAQSALELHQRRGGRQGLHHWGELRELLQDLPVGPLPKPVRAAHMHHRRHRTCRIAARHDPNHIIKQKIELATEYRHTCSMICRPTWTACAPGTCCGCSGSTPRSPLSDREYGRRHRPKPPDWIIELGIGTGQPPVQIHAGNCYMAGKRRRPVDRDEARRLLTDGLHACSHCRPEARLDIDLPASCAGTAARLEQSYHLPLCSRTGDSRTPPNRTTAVTTVPPPNHRARSVRARVLRRQSRPVRRLPA